MKVEETRRMSTETELETPNLSSESVGESKQIPHRVVTVNELHILLNKYHKLSSWETAVKLLVDDGLIIWGKDTSGVN